MHRILSVLAFAASACSAGATRATGGGADAGGLPSCSDDAGAPDGATCVVEAKGTVTDLSGVPLPNIVMTLCGSQCYGIPSDDAGAYAIPVGTFLPTAEYAIHADGRPDHAVDYLRLTANEPPVITATMRLPTFPPSDVVLPPDGAPASSVTVGDLTLVIAAGTTFNLDIEDYGTGNVGRTLRVAAVPPANAPAYAKAASADTIYALAPSHCLPSIPMGVVLKNSAGLPASAAVDLLVLGDDYFSTPPSVGILSVQATGHVSADGMTIQTDPGQGIDELTWLAVRKAN
jgi:hypothetical protein